jgi:hypothetical protein
MSNWRAQKNRTCEIVSNDVEDLSKCNLRYISARL